MISLKRLEAAITRCTTCGQWAPHAGDPCTACGVEVPGAFGRPDVDAVRECCLTLPGEDHGTRSMDCALSWENTKVNR